MSIARASRCSAKFVSVSAGFCLIFSFPCFSENKPSFEVNVNIPTESKSFDTSTTAKFKSYFRGGSWESPISQKTDEMLRGIGMDTVRIINMEGKAAILAPGKYDLSSWNAAIADCEKYGFVPHFVVGTRPQANGGRKLDVESPEYKAYARSVVRYLLGKSKSSKVIFEVGNEPDINGMAWLLDQPLDKGKTKMYLAYLKLYATWAEAVDLERKSYPEKQVLVGGPAISTFTHHFGDFAWGPRFITDAAKYGYSMDFFSFHFYGDVASIDPERLFGKYPAFQTIYAQYKETLRNVKKESVPVYVSEWGASSDVSSEKGAEVNGGSIGAAWSAHFAMMMAKEKVDMALPLILRDHVDARANGKNNWAWPGFLLSDGVTPKSLYYLADQVHKLPEFLAKTDIGGAQSINAIAAYDSCGVNVLIVNDDWNFIDRQHKVGTVTGTVHVSGLPSGITKLMGTVTEISSEFGDVWDAERTGQSVQSGPRTSEVEAKRVGTEFVFYAIDLPSSAVVNLSFKYCE